MPKPASLAGRGGAWFEAGGVRLHAPLPCYARAHILDPFENRIELLEIEA